MIKIMHRYFRSRWERFYIKNRWHLAMDMSLVLVIIILAAVSFSLYSYRPEISWLSGFRGPELDLDNPPLATEFSLDAPVIKDGGEVNFKVYFNNKGKVKVSDIKIDLEMLSSDFSINRLEAVAGSGESLKINGSIISLPSLSPGQSGEISAVARIKRHNASARSLAWQARIEYIFGGKLFKSSASIPEVIIAADLKIRSLAYYHSPRGDQLGIGPLPPIVGIPTKYWIFWEVESDGYFQDVVLSARLPQGVSIAEGRTRLAGEFDYNEYSRQVVWKLKEIKAGEESQRVGFELSFLPDASHVGKSWPLLTISRYRGRDVLSGQDREGGFKEPTTDLEDDSLNRGQGRVERE